jgi:hypothetical protein
MSWYAQRTKRAEALKKALVSSGYSDAEADVLVKEQEALVEGFRTQEVERLTAAKELKLSYGINPESGMSIRGSRKRGLLGRIFGDNEEVK